MNRDSFDATRALTRLAAGIVAANAVGLAVCAGAAWLGAQHYGSRGNIVTIPSLTLVPAIIGFVAGWIWKPLRLTLASTLLHSFFCTFAGLLGASWLFGEGMICLVILSPLLYIGVAAGALFARAFFRKFDGGVNVWLVPALMIIAASEPLTRTSHQGVVVDEITIARPPAKVWPHVQAFDTIPAKPDYWLFKLGLPYPTSTTNDGGRVGADRACNFSGNAVFKEKIVQFEPQHLLTFEIVEAPADPELLGHLDAHRGQFELRDNGDGTTTLIGRTWYTLHVRPAWYFDGWTHDIFRAVHLRVMRNIKMLAETAYDL